MSCLRVLAPGKFPMDSVRPRNDKECSWGKRFIPGFTLKAVGRALESRLYPAVCRSVIHLCLYLRPEPWAELFI